MEIAALFFINSPRLRMFTRLHLHHASTTPLRRLAAAADNCPSRRGISLFSNGPLMNKTELIESIATKAGVTRAAATTMLDATLGTITEALAAGDTVALLGFGTFKV